MKIEGLILTGGAGRRMGVEKARLIVEGVSIAERTARHLGQHCEKVTVLGRAPLPGYAFQEDQEAFAGPLSALARFAPQAEAVFIASCDMPRFDGQLIPFLHAMMGENLAVVPGLDDHLQPLCAVYSAKAWDGLQGIVESGKRSMIGWLESLSCRVVTVDELRRGGLDPQALQGANTPDEWQRLVRE